MNIVSESGQIRIGGRANRVLTLHEVLNIPNDMSVWVETSGGLISRPKAEWRTKDGERLYSASGTYFSILTKGCVCPVYGAWKWRAWLFQPTPLEQKHHTKWTYSEIEEDTCMEFNQNEKPNSSAWHMSEIKCSNLISATVGATGTATIRDAAIATSDISTKAVESALIKDLEPTSNKLVPASVAAPHLEPVQQELTPSPFVVRVGESEIRITESEITFKSPSIGYIHAQVAVDKIHPQITAHTIKPQ